MPSGLFTPEKQYSQSYTPQSEYIEASDLESIAFLLNKTINYPDYGTEYDFDAEGCSGCYILVSWETPYMMSKGFFFQHETWRWWIFKNYEYMRFVRDEYDTVDITLPILQNYWDNSTNSTKVTPISVPSLSINAWFTDADHDRNNITAAWNDGAIEVTIGFGWDNATMGYSAWNLIAQLMTFQSPDIHPALNYLIAIPIWSAIAYLIARIILLIIPFVG